jgi:hypothetical protein
MLIAQPLVLTRVEEVPTGFESCRWKGKARIKRHGTPPNPSHPGFELREGDVLETADGRVVLERAKPKLEVEKDSTLIFSEAGISAGIQFAEEASSRAPMHGRRCG